MPPAPHFGVPFGHAGWTHTAPRWCNGRARMPRRRASLRRQASGVGWSGSSELPARELAGVRTCTINSPILHARDPGGSVGDAGQAGPGLAGLRQLAKAASDEHAAEEARAHKHGHGPRSLGEAAGRAGSQCDPLGAPPSRCTPCSRRRGQSPCDGRCEARKSSTAAAPQRLAPCAASATCHCIGPH